MPANPTNLEVANIDLVKALHALSHARKAHPGLEQIGEVMHDVDAVVSLFDRLVEEQAAANPLPDAQPAEAAKEPIERHRAAEEPPTQGMSNQPIPAPFAGIGSTSTETHAIAGNAASPTIVQEQKP